MCIGMSSHGGPPPKKQPAGYNGHEVSAPRTAVCFIIFLGSIMQSYSAYTLPNIYLNNVTVH